MSEDELTVYVLDTFYASSLGLTLTKHGLIRVFIENGDEYAELSLDADNFKSLKRMIRRIEKEMNERAKV